MKDTKILMTYNMESADCFTHSGTFHADEVMATAIIAEASDKVGVCVYRTPTLNGVSLSWDSIIYDLGGGKYDHHQKGGNGVRENGIPYSSCGLIWRDFGMKICQAAGTTNQGLIWKLVDEALIQGIDAIDNGVIPKGDSPCKVMSLSGVISSFNTNWDDPDYFQDNRFLEAVNMARTVFKNVLSGAISKAKAFDNVMRAVDASNEGLMVLDTFMPWQEFMFSCDTDERIEKSKDILYVIYPSNRGGYQWRVVPMVPGSFEQRNHVPENWKGLTGDELVKVSGISTATFAHPNGFIGGASEKSDCIEMARKAISLGKRAQ